MNLIEAAAHARDVERFEAVRKAVLAAKKAQYEFNIKGGAGSGAQSGHHFGGNRYTGGISEGATGYVAHPRLHAVKPFPEKYAARLARVRISCADFDKIANDQVELSRKPIMPDFIEQKVPVPDATESSHVKSTVTQILAMDTGLTYARANQMVATWAASSSDTTPDSVALQAAVAAKFGVDPGTFLSERISTMGGGYRAALEAGPPPPRMDVDESGRLLDSSGQRITDEEGHSIYAGTHYDTNWNSKMSELNEAIKLSMMFDDKTSFVVPKEYMGGHERMDATSNPNFVTTVDENLHEVLHPYPGFGTNVYTESNYWEQEKLPNGDVRFTRDNTLSTRLPGDQEAARLNGELPISWDQRMSDAAKVVDAMYERTQKLLAENGVKEMTVFRGMNWNGYAIGGDASELPAIPDALREPQDEYEERIAREDLNESRGTWPGEHPVEIDLNPLSSFSVNYNTAADGFGRGDRGVTLAVTVPADRIFSLASTGLGCLHEGEVVVIGGPTKLTGGRHAFEFYKEADLDAPQKARYAQSEFYG